MQMKMLQMMVLVELNNIAMLKFLVCVRKWSKRAESIGWLSGLLHTGPVETIAYLEQLFNSEMKRSAVPSCQFHKYGFCKYGD